MKKLNTLPFFTFTLLLACTATLFYSNKMLHEQNALLSSQVSILSEKLDSLSTSSKNVESRVAEIEENMVARYRDLTVSN